jgi:hypothetical protein
MKKGFIKRKRNKKRIVELLGRGSKLVVTLLAPIYHSLVLQKILLLFPLLHQAMHITNLFETKI